MLGAGAAAQETERPATPPAAVGRGPVTVAELPPAPIPPRYAEYFGLGDPAPRMFVAVALEQERFERAARPGGAASGTVRSGVALDSHYRYAGVRNTLRLGNGLHLSRDLTAGRWRFGSANLDARFSRAWPRLRFAVEHSFAHGDDPDRFAAPGLRRIDAASTRVRVAPRILAAVTRHTNLSWQSDHTLVSHDEPALADTASHGLSGLLEHQFDARLTGGLSYRGRATDSDTDSTRHALSGLLSYRRNQRMTVVFGVAASHLNRTGGLPDAHTAAATLGFRRTLGRNFGYELSLGAVQLGSDAAAPRYEPLWQLSFTGEAPLLLSPRTSIRFGFHQGLADTATELDDVGVVLRRTAEVRLRHELSPRLTADLVADYIGNERLLPDPARFGISRLSDVAGGAAGLSWAWRRTVRVDARAGYQHRLSGLAPGEDRGGYQLGLSLSTVYPLF